MPIKTYLVLLQAKDGRRRRLTIVADSESSARAKARKRAGTRAARVVKVIRLHEGPPRERA